MTLIPKQQEQTCFIACSEDKIKSGLCDCINKIKNKALLNQVVSKQICECGNSIFTHRHSNWIECTSCNKIKILKN